MSPSDESRTGIWANDYQRSAMGVDVVERRLGIIIGDENCASISRIIIKVHLASHDVVNNHSERRVAVANLLQWTGSHNFRIRGLDTASMVVRLIDIDKFWQGAGRNHAIKVLDELFCTALVRDVEVISRIVAVQTVFSISVLSAEHRQYWQLHEIGLPQPLGRRGSVASVD